MAVLELRAADPQRRAMRPRDPMDATLPRGARVLEVGGGAGAVTRVPATWPGVADTIGVDPSPVTQKRWRR
jgi:spermidine synthase